MHIRVCLLEKVKPLEDSAGKAKRINPKRTGIPENPNRVGFPQNPKRVGFRTRSLSPNAMIYTHDISSLNEEDLQLERDCVMKSAVVQLLKSGYLGCTYVLDLFSLIEFL